MTNIISTITHTILFIAIVLIIITISSIIYSNISCKKININLDSNDIIWSERNRKLFGLPISFTKYSLSKDRLFVMTGLLNTTENETRLYRVLDIKLTRNILQRIYGLGTIKVCSSDKELSNFSLENIRNCKEVKETISTLVEKQRDEKRVYNREIMSATDEY